MTAPVLPLFAAGHPRAPRQPAAPLPVEWRPRNPVDLARDEVAHSVWCAVFELGREFTVDALHAAKWWGALPEHGPAFERLLDYGLLVRLVGGTGKLLGWRMTDKGYAWCVTTSREAIAAGFVDRNDCPAWLVEPVLGGAR